MDEAKLQRIHARLLEADPTASLDLWEACASPLLAQLRRRWPTTPPETCEDAVIETLFSYLRAPQTYSPARGSLAGLLTLSAHRDLQNAVEREERQRPPGTHSLDRVELDAEGRKTVMGERVADRESDPSRWLDEVDPELVAQIGAVLPEERDRKILDLIVSGERKTEVFASLLGLQPLGAEEQQRQVKREKDRVLARVRRQLKGWKDG